MCTEPTLRFTVSRALVTRRCKVYIKKSSIPVSVLITTNCKLSGVSDEIFVWLTLSLVSGAAWLSTGGVSQPLLSGSAHCCCGRRHAAASEALRAKVSTYAQILEKVGYGMRRGSHRKLSPYTGGLQLAKHLPNKAQPHLTIIILILQAKLTYTVLKKIHTFSHCAWICSTLQNITKKIICGIVMLNV